MNANAGDLRAEALAQADTRLLELARRIEDGADSLAPEDTAELTHTYQNLEFECVRAGYLDPSETLIQEAVAEGAEKWTPETLQRTQESLGALDQMIKPGLADYSEISTTADSVQAQAEFLVRMVRRSRLVAITRPESTALELENGSSQLSQLKEKISELDGVLGLNAPSATP
jgi:hypothetical protein